MKLQQPVLPLIPAFVALLESEIEKAITVTDSGLIFNFRDPHYSAETGGYHPVEIAIAEDGALLYITDFTYYGDGHYAELGKELDFDFSYGLFQQMGRDYPIQEGAGLFKMWQANFVSYYQSGVFQVSTSAL